MSKKYENVSLDGLQKYCFWNNEPPFPQKYRPNRRKKKQNKQKLQNRDEDVRKKNVATSASCCSYPHFILFVDFQYVWQKPVANPPVIKIYRDLFSICKSEYDMRERIIDLLSAIIYEKNLSTKWKCHLKVIWNSIGLCSP